MTALPDAAAKAQVSADCLLTHDPMTIAQFVLALAAVLGFARSVLAVDRPRRTTRSAAIP